MLILVKYLLVCKKSIILCRKQEQIFHIYHMDINYLRGFTVARLGCLDSSGLALRAACASCVRPCPQFLTGQGSACGNEWTTFFMHIAELEYPTQRSRWASLPSPAARSSSCRFLCCLAIRKSGGRLSRKVRPPP